MFDKKKLLATLLLGMGLGAATLAIRARGGPATDAPSPGEFPVATDGRKPRVVVLGAGFAGIAATDELARAFRDGALGEVTLIDRNNYHLFTPLLYQVAAGTLQPDFLAYPVRQSFAERGVVCRTSEVKAVDLEGKQVITSSGPVPYDYLIIALGATTGYFGNAEIQRYTQPLKTLRDALAIRNRVLASFEQAELTDDPAQRRELLNFVVVGGGATGVEMAGALRDYVYGTLARNYPRLDVTRDVKIILVEAGQEILGDLDRGLARVALDYLRHSGVEVRLGTRVVDVRPGELRADAGEIIPTRNVIWATGIEAWQQVARLPAPKAQDGRLEVDACLGVPGYPGVYTVGDTARAVDAKTGRPLPPNAPAAIESGRLAAANVLRSLAGKPQRPLRYRRRGDLIALGEYKAVAEVGPLKVDGLLAWLLFRSFYLWRLMGMKNRLRVFVAWVLSPVYRQEAVEFEC